MRMRTGQEDMTQRQIEECNVFGNVKPKATGKKTIPGECNVFCGPGIKVNRIYDFDTKTWEYADEACDAGIFLQNLITLG